MSGLHPRFQSKSAESIAFGLYLRTGRRVSPEFIAEVLEQQFNPYHDPDDGRFASAATGIDYGGHSAVQATQQRGGSAASPLRNKPPAPYPVRIKLPPSRPLPRASNGLGGLSMEHETSGRGVSTVSSGVGRNGVQDRGGVSYGSYQLTSQTPDRDKNGKLVIRRDGGNVARFLRAEGARWASEFAGVAPGSKDFTKVWSRIAQREGPALHVAEHAYVKRQNYDPAVHRIRAAIGIDFDRAPLVVRDVLWSTSVQHGAGGATGVRGGATRIFIDAVERTDLTAKRVAPNYYETLVGNIYARRTAYWPSDRPRYRDEMRNALRRLRDE